MLIQHGDKNVKLTAAFRMNGTRLLLVGSGGEHIILDFDSPESAQQALSEIRVMLKIGIKRLDLQEFKNGGA